MDAGYKTRYALNVIIPAIQREGLTIKTRRGEWTISPTNPAVATLINQLSTELTNQLNQLPQENINF